jgi:hypothetical protein
MLAGGGIEAFAGVHGVSGWIDFLTWTVGHVVSGRASIAAG